MLIATFNGLMCCGINFRLAAMGDCRPRGRYFQERFIDQYQRMVLPGVDSAIWRLLRGVVIDLAKRCSTTAILREQPRQGGEEILAVRLHLDAMHRRFV